MIRTELLPQKEVTAEHDNFLCLDKSLFNIDKNIFNLCAYIPPEHSPYYAFTGFENGIDLLEEILVDEFLCKKDICML